MDYAPLVCPGALEPAVSQQFSAASRKQMKALPHAISCLHTREERKTEREGADQACWSCTVGKECSLNLEAAGRLPVPLCVPSLLQGNTSVLLLCQPGSQAVPDMGFPQPGSRRNLQF